MDKSLLFWTAQYALESLVLAWLIFWGGAERLDGTWLAALFTYRGAETSAGGIKLIAWLLWIGATFWFIWGLAEPTLRMW